MTDAEIEQEMKRAEILAASLGGALAVLIGSKPGNVTWDAETASFRVNGRRVSAATIRRELRRIETGTGVRIGRLTDKLSRREITLRQWQDGFKQLVGSSHVLMAALGAGSIAAAAKNLTVQSRIDTERGYADGFAKDIEKKQLKPPTIKARARSYMLAAAVTFAGVGLAARIIAGYTEARRVRTAAESCEGCIRWSGKWFPIDEIKPIGTLQCGHRCRCFLEYR